MRTLVKLSVFCLTAATTVLFAASIANAADQNTYRPGTPYLKTVANHFNQCEQQCRGDAQCRSWNFVRANAGAASGICEFNSRMVTPVSSSVSMSGTINTNVDSLMSHAAAANKGTRTIRVGTPIRIRAASPQNKQSQNKRPQHKRPQSPSMRKTIVKRQAIPEQYAPQRANHTQPLAQQVKRPQLTPQQTHYRQQYLARKKHQADMQRQQFMHQQQSGQHLSQGLQPQRPTPQIQAPQMQAHVQVPPQTNIAQTRRPLRPLPPQAMQQQARQQQRPQGLYGSLHDDLTQNLSTIPRPQTAPDNLNNPDAPISTSRAVPTIPVQESQMKAPSGLGSLASGLAGG